MTVSNTEGRFFCVDEMMKHTGVGGTVLLEHRGTVPLQYLRCLYQQTQFKMRLYCRIYIWSTKRSGYHLSLI